MTKAKVLVQASFVGLDAYVRVDRTRFAWLDVAMRSVKIAELKDKLSEHLRAVEAGEEVVVTDRNRPIARIIPVQPGGPALSIDEPSSSFKTVRARKWRATRWRLNATELLDAERGEE